MDHAGDLPIGRIRGIRACASERGTFAVLALDHRQNLRRELGPDDPAAVTFAAMVDFKRAVVRAVGGAATGILLDPEIGAAQAVVDGSLPPGCGLLVAIEATGYTGSATARTSQVLEGWSAAKAKRIGASAAKLLVYYHPDSRVGGRPGAAARRGGGRLPGGGPGPVRRAAVVLDRPGRAGAHRRGAPAGGSRDGTSADRARR